MSIFIYACLLVLNCLSVCRLYASQLNFYHISPLNDANESSYIHVVPISVMVLKREITEKQNNNIPTKKAKKKDHNKPRGVRYPSNLYKKLNHERIHAEHKGLNDAEVNKKCSEEWNFL